MFTVGIANFAQLASSTMMKCCVALEMVGNMLLRLLGLCHGTRAAEEKLGMFHGWLLSQILNEGKQLYKYFLALMAAVGML